MDSRAPDNRKSLTALEEQVSRAVDVGLRQRDTIRELEGRVRQAEREMTEMVEIISRLSGEGDQKAQDAARVRDLEADRERIRARLHAILVTIARAGIRME